MPVKAEMFLEERKEEVHIDRFADEVITADAAAVVAVHVEGAGGDGDDGDGGGGGVLAKLVNGFEAGHDGHDEIHENEIGGVIEGGGDRFLAIGNEGEVEAEGGKHAGEDETVSGVVIGDEELAAGAVVAGDGLGWWGVGGGVDIGEGEGEGEVEGSAVVGLAIELDGAVHELDETLADGEAEASAEGGLLAGTGLFERFKNELVLVGGDAGAGIGDAEGEGGVVIGIGGGDLEGDAAEGGEFNGVAEEIEEDLAETFGIGEDEGGEVGVRVVGELQSFLLGGEAHEGDEVVDKAVEIEGGGIDG